MTPGAVHMSGMERIYLIDQILAGRNQAVNRAEFVGQIHQTLGRVVGIEMECIPQDRQPVCWPWNVLESGWTVHLAEGPF